MISAFVKEKIRQMLAEDVGFGDITTEAILEPEVRAEARIVNRQAGILAGTVEAAFAFEEAGARASAVKKDGDPIKPSDVVMRIEGPAPAILEAERVALNLLMRMSGVATATREMVERARRINPKVVIAATRKTLPLFGYFDKRAAVIGGGDPHRFRLDDCALIKSDHVKLAGSIEEAIKRVKRVSFSKKVEIEVDRAEDAVKAARAGVEIVMFDNVPPAEIKRAVGQLEKAGLRRKVLLEASGGVVPSNVASYAATGVDIITSSYMTFQAPAIDMNLEIFGGKTLIRTPAKKAKTR